MTRIVITVLAGLVAFSSAQNIQPGYLDIPGVTPPPWQGPLADHISGIPPKDTPEVAAAKAALNQAYAQVLAVLPPLPQDENVVREHHVSLPQYVHQNIHHGEPTTAPTIKTFAEEVPRSPIGEVPEVHAARVAHLKAVQEASAALPRLADVPVTPMIQQVSQHPGLVFQDYLQSQQPSPYYSGQDTPEVAKAKADHAAAVAAALG